MAGRRVLLRRVIVDIRSRAAVRRAGSGLWAAAGPRYRGRWHGWALARALAGGLSAGVVLSRVRGRS